MKKQADLVRLTFLISGLCLALDVVTKMIVTKQNTILFNIPVIKNFFNITYLRNRGALLGLFNDKIPIITLLTICMLFAILKFFVPNIKSKLEMFGYGLLIGGVCGNFVERVAAGYVTDFLQFCLFNRTLPVFNLADVFICLGVALIVVDFFRSEYYENRNKRNPKQKN